MPRCGAWLRLAGATSTRLGLPVLASDSLFSLPRCCLRSRSPSCPPSRQTMENSRLPIEVCERIIDECSDFDWIDCPNTLRACALTCSQWLPRSQYNLYHELGLEDSEAAGSIVDTFTARPELAEHVRVIGIWPSDCYVPLTQLLSLPSLKKCQRLEMNIDLTNFPPRYVQNCLAPLLTKFVNVVQFDYAMQSTASAIGIFHIIWAMPQLLWCGLYCEDILTLAASLLDNLKKTAWKIKPRLHLNTLILDHEVSSQHEHPNLIASCKL